MKAIYRLLSIAAVMLVAFACQSVPEEGSLEELSAKAEKGVHCYLPSIEFDTPATKGVNAGSTFSVTFDQNDKIGVWPSVNDHGQYQTYTLDVNNDNTANARFEGGAFDITDGSSYTSIYPRIWTDEWPAVPISFEGQTQTGDATSAHLKSYLYAWAGATCSDGSATFNYAYNAGFIQFVLTFNGIEDPIQVNEVKLVSDSKVFAANPTLDVQTGELTKGTLTNEISIALSGVTVNPGGTITVNMAAAPFESATVTVQAKDATNKSYTSISKTISALETGKCKRLTRDMSYIDLAHNITIDSSTETEKNLDVDGNLYVTIIKSDPDNTVSTMAINAKTATYPDNVYITVSDQCTLNNMTLNIDMPNSHVVISAAAEEEIGAINTITSLNTLVLTDMITVGSVAIQENGGGLTVDGKITGTLTVPNNAAVDQTEPEKIWVKINESAEVGTISVGETNCNLYIAGTVGTVITSAAQTTVDGNIATALTANASAEVVVTSNGSVAGATVTANGQSEVYIVEGADTEGATLNDNNTTSGVNTGSIVPVDEPEAAVNGVEYMTFAKALAMVPTNGVKTTVKLLSDVALEEGFTVAATQNMVLDLNGKTLSCAVSKTVSSALITNRGTLVIKDSDDTNHDGSGDGLLRYSNATPDQSTYFSNVVTNNGDLTIESGHLHNTSTGGSAAYVVDNISNSTTCTPTFIMNGGKLDNEYSDAIRLFLNSTTNLNKVVINGGIINSKKASGRVIVMQDSNAYASKGELDITGGTINGKVNAWNAGNQPTEEFTAEQYAAISINISGGYIKQLNFTNEMSDAALRASTLKVTGGYYNVNPDVDPEKPQVSAGYRVVESGNADFPFKVELTPAAKIGTTEYATLAEAFEAVGEGQTITILTDIDFSQPDYSGYKWAGSVYNPLELCANGVTIDLDGHTFSNMGNCAIAIGHLLAKDGRISNLTIKNGTMLAGKTDNVTNSYVLLIAGVENMTIKDITTNGGINVCSGSTGVVIEDCTINGTKYYTVCAQTGSQVTIKGTTYTKNTDATVANKSMFWIQGASTDSDMVTSTNPTGAFGASSITIENGTYTVDFTNGGVFYLTSGVAPSLKGGTYNFNANAYCAPGYEAVDNGNGTWTVSEIQGVAQIGSTRYASLAEAIAAVQSNETITLIKDIALSSTEEYEGKDFVLNGDGHIINSAAAITTTTYPLAFGDANFAISNATFTSQWTTENKQNYNVLVYASSKETTALLSNVSISSNQQTALCVQGYNSNITTVTLENLTITNTGTRTGSDAYRSAAVATAFGGKVIINSGTYSSEVQAVRQFSSGGDITINGGTFSGKIVAHLDKGSYSQYPAIITINGGTFNNCSFEVIHNNGDTSANIVIYGGTFDADPSAYVAEGYIAVYSATTHKYTVEAAQYWEAEAVSDEAFAAITDETNKIISISTAAQLAKLAKNVNAHVPLTEGFTYKGYTVKLEADINLAGKIWTPIGVCEDWTRGHFSGTFDGQGHTISNLKVVREDRAGLFGSIYGEAVIKDLNVTNVTLIANHFAAGIVGWINEENYDLVVDNCSVIGGVITVVPNFVNNEWDNGDKCGGVVGYSNQNTANHCKITNNTAENLTITAYRDCGGIVGFCSGNVLVSGNKAKNVTLVQDNFRGYQSSVTTVQQIVGRNGNGGSTQENNTATGVVINTVN